MGWKTYGANSASRTRQRNNRKKEKLKKIKNPYFLFCSETKKLNNKTSLCLRKNRKIIFLPQKPKKSKNPKPPEHSQKQRNAAHALTPHIVLLLLEGHSRDHGGHYWRLNIWWSGLILPL
ncbi:MAG: hypothetical protein RQ750_06210 [Roseovarius sp.]|nr:hypothetical protein [Roseovarius sp.]